MESQQLTTDKLRIRQVITDNFGTPFQWGTWDCCIFVFTCFDPDNVDVLRGQYTDKAGAYAKSDELGGFDAYLTGRGASRVAKADCRTGDIVCFENGTGLGIVERESVVTVNEAGGGMVKLPRSVIESGWRF